MEPYGESVQELSNSKETQKTVEAGDFGCLGAIIFAAVGAFVLLAVYFNGH